MNLSASESSRRRHLLSGRCQTRGGRKGGLPVWEWKSLLSNGDITPASSSGNDSGDEATVDELKHFMAQVAMVPQSSMALSQGLAAGGQQSCIGPSYIDPPADISVASCDFSLKAAAPAAGSNATDAAIRRAHMVRANAIFGVGSIPPRPLGGQVTISRGPEPRPRQVGKTTVHSPAATTAPTNWAMMNPGT
jgi:hypothetical protein